MRRASSGLAASFSVAYSYTKNLEMKGEVANGFVSMFLFMMVCAPVQQVTLADGSTKNMLDSSFLGGSGMFTAIIMAILVVRIIKFFQDHHIALKMPDSVPPFLSDSFATLIPLLANIVLWLGLNTLLQNVMGANIPAAIMGILSIPLNALVSGPGMIVIVFIAMLFWSVGIHGTMIAYMVIMPVMMQAYGVNAELVASGTDPVFNPVFLFGAAACCGGTGTPCRWPSISCAPSPSSAAPSARRASCPRFSISPSRSSSAHRSCSTRSCAFRSS